MGNTYPENTPQGQFLREYARRFATVEIDSTFYGIPRESAVLKWRDETPDGFLFAPKFPKEITHDNALVNCTETVSAFLERVSLLGKKLGPLLLQFPYGFKSDSFSQLKAFLAKLPSDFRYAMEVRHKSWISEKTYDLLRTHRVAFALIDHPWMPKLDVLTTDFTYIRWLGDRKKIEKDFNQTYFDRTRDLEKWIEIISRISTQDLIIYGYFNNHYAGHSPSTLALFRKLLADHDNRTSA